MIERCRSRSAMGIRLVEATPTRVVGELHVRDDLCTANAILHGGAVMAFADSLGAVARDAEPARGRGDHDAREQDQFRRRRARRRHRARGLRARPYRPRDDGLADARSRAATASSPRSSRRRR